MKDMGRMRLSAMAVLIMLIAVAALTALPTIALADSRSSSAGYTFDPVSGALAITTDDGFDNWKHDGISATAVKDLVVSEGVTEIPHDAFDGCGNLAHAGLPSTLEEIEQDAFARTGLTSLDLTACLNLTYIDDLAFIECAKLSAAVFPASLTRIGESAFAGCMQLASFEFYGSSAPSLGNAVFVNVAPTGTLRYPVGGTGYGAVLSALPAAWTAEEACAVVSSAGPHGAIDPAGIVRFTASPAAVQIYSITPDAGYLIDDVLVDGASVKDQVVGGVYTLSSIVADHTIEAIFKVDRSNWAERTLRDGATGVEVMAFCAPDAMLAVKDMLHAEGTCAACDEIRAYGTPLAIYDISISGGYEGVVDVAIPVGASFDGRDFSILHCASGQLENVASKAEGGFVRGTFASLSPFAVFDVGNPLPSDIDTPLPKDTGTSLPDDVGASLPKSGDATPIAPIVVLAAGSLAVCTVFGSIRARRHRMSR